MEETFGRWLRRRREALRLPRERLAEQVPCSMETIRKLESGERRASSQLANRLAELLAIPHVECPAFVQAARTGRRPSPAAARASGDHPRMEWRTTLAAQREQLIGREQELAAVCELLARDDVGLVTLTGPGGVGKTRLALAIAAAAGEYFVDGTLFVDLSALSDPDLVLPTIAQTLQVKETAGESLLLSMRTRLRDRHMLLMLDNFEHVLDAGLVVAELLSAAPRLRVLVTSREALHLRGERELVVPPLALPGAGVHELAVLTRSEAVRLFIERARAVKADFQLTTANAPAVAEICIRLDGLPLAIELAAVWVKLLSPRELLARLSDRLTLLISRQPDLPARQQTMRAAIDWSYQLLEPIEQLVFMRLAVFVGGWTLKAAEDVCTAAGITTGDVLHALRALVDLSLVQHHEQGHDGRFTMLETIRDYAHEKLLASGELSRMRSAHLTHYTHLTRVAVQHYYGPEQVNWLARLESTYDNVRAALQWALDQDDSECALQLGAALGRYWFVRGDWSEGRQWLQQVRALRQRSSSSHRSARACGWYAEVLWHEGNLAWSQGDITVARTLLHQSLTHFREVDDQGGSADVLSVLGGVAFEQGDYATARTLYEEALASWRRLGNMERIGSSLFTLGLVRFNLGDVDIAQTLLEESLIHLRESAHRLGISYTLHSLGDLATARGEYAAARQLYEESLALRRELGDKRGVATTRSAMATILARQGEHAAARALLGESLICFRELGYKRGMARTLSGLACICQARGHLRTAVEVLSGVETLLAQMDTRLDEPDQSEKQSAIAALRSQLDAESFTVAWERGSALTLEELIALIRL